MWRLLDMLFPPREDERALRGVSDEAFLAHLAPRAVPQTRPAAVMLLPFSQPVVRSALHEAKYHGNSRAFDLLALALIEYLRDADDRPQRFALVPVPLGKERQKERGFNQVEEVVKRAAKELDGLVETGLIERTRETVSQVSLPREKREENMRGAFGAAHSAHSTYTYIVVDDVMTTGATLQAAIDALKEAGAEHIIPIALAH